MSDARLSILISSDLTQAQVGFEKLISVVNKTESGIEKSTAGMSADVVGLVSTVDKSFSSIQSKVQGFGGGAAAFKAPTFDLSSIKPIPAGVTESFTQFRNIAAGALSDLEKQGVLSLGSLAVALNDFKARLKVATDPGDVIRLNAAIAELSNKTLQVKVQQFGGGVASFQPPKIDLSTVKPIPPEVVASFRTLSESAETASAKTSSALRAILSPVEILKNQLIRLQKIASLEGLSFKQYERIQSLLASTRGQLDRFSTGFKNIAPGANSAGFALQNLGRVAQDIPFGFIGIQNNINPLLESFQRLKRETGSTKLALQALGKSFLGAGGLGLAVSIASSAILLLTTGFQSFSRKTSQVRDRTEEDIKKINEAWEKVTGGPKILIDQTQSLADKQKALKEAFDAAATSVVSQAGKYADLRAALSSTNNDVNILTGSIIKQGVAQALFSSKEGLVREQISKAIANQINIQKVLNTLKEKEFKIQPKSVKPIRIATDADLGKAGIGLDLIEQKIFDINALAKSLGLDFSEFVKPPKGNTEAEKEIDRIIAKGKRLLSEFGDTANIHLSILPTFSELDSKPEQLTKAKEIIKKVDNFFNAFSSSQRALKLIIPFEAQPFLIPPDRSPDQFTQAQITEILKGIADFKPEPISIKADISLDTAVRVDDAGKKFGDAFSEAFRKAVKENLAKGLGLKEAITGADEITTALQQMSNSINESIQGLAAGGLANIGETIGTALGGGDLKGVFANFGNIVSEGFKAIGQALIQFGVLKALAKKAFTSLNAGVAIAVGIAFVAAGAALKAALNSGVKGFAEGGRPEPGKLSVITEKGTEAFVSDAGKVTMLEGKGPQFFKPTVPGRIVPNYALGSIKGKLSPVQSTITRVTERIFVTDVQKQLEKLVNSFKTATTSTITSVFKDFRSTDRLRTDNYVSDSTKDKGESISKLVTLFKDKISITANNTFEKDSVLKIAGYFKDLKTTDSKTDKHSNYFTNDSFDNYFKEKTSTSKQTDNNYFNSRIASLFKDNVSSELSKLISIDKQSDKSIELSKVFSNYLQTNDLLKIVTSSKATDKEYFKEVLSSSNVNTNSIKEFFSTASSLKQVISDYFSKNSESKLISNRSVFSQIDKVLSKVISFDKESVLSSSSKEVSVLKELFKQLIPSISNTSNNYSDRTNIFNHNVESWFTKQGDFVHSIVSSSSALNNLFKTFNQAIPHRQFGGPVTAGNPFFVGETGRELFVPQASGTIIPKGNMSGLGPVGEGRLVGEFRLAGTDLVLAVQRELGKQGRLV